MVVTTEQTSPRTFLFSSLIQCTTFSKTIPLSREMRHKHSLIGLKNNSRAQLALLRSLWLPAMNTLVFDIITRCYGTKIILSNTSILLQNMQTRLSLKFSVMITMEIWGITLLMKLREHISTTWSKLLALLSINRTTQASRGSKSMKPRKNPLDSSTNLWTCSKVSAWRKPQRTQTWNSGS
jgi:hypothetical protein